MHNDNDNGILVFLRCVGSEGCVFNVHNTSKSNKLLLYKIRRSEPQLVSFYPKHGVIRQGELHEIELNVVNSKVRW